jgi:hypothetical protein
LEIPSSAANAKMDGRVSCVAFEWKLVLMVLYVWREEIA